MHQTIIRLLAATVFVATLLCMLGPRASADQTGYTWWKNTAPQETCAGSDNPLRGYYTWLSNKMVPLTTEPSLSYYRWSWTSLEKGENEYDFTVIEKALARLAPGQRISFAMMPLCTMSKGVPDVPDYMVKGMEKGFFVPYKMNPSKTFYVPDWNDKFYINRLDSLLQALAKKYDGDPRIAYIDIRSFGNFGEGHMWGDYGSVQYGDKSSNIHGALPATTEARIAAASLYLKAFKRTRLIAMTDDTEVLCYLLGQKTAIPIGLRRDSFGSVHFRDIVPTNLKAEDRDMILNRWKTAPFIVEPGTGPRFEDGCWELVSQVSTYHVSAIGNGNIAKWDVFTPEQQIALNAAGKLAGFLLRPMQVRYPNTIAPGVRFNLETRWCNIGSAPVYENWVQTFSLVAADGTVAWTGTPKFDLKRLMPAEMYLDQRDSFTLPTTVKPGTYSVTLSVIDPTGFLPPMALGVDIKPTKSGYPIATTEVLPPN